MGNSFGNGVDVTPFIVGAYVLGAILILGYALWTIIDRRRLQGLLRAVSEDLPDVKSYSHQGDQS